MNSSKKPTHSNHELTIGFNRNYFQTSCELRKLKLKLHGFPRNLLEKLLKTKGSREAGHVHLDFFDRGPVTGEFSFISYFFFTIPDCF